MSLKFHYSSQFQTFMSGFVGHISYQPPGRFGTVVRDSDLLLRSISDKMIFIPGPVTTASKIIGFPVEYSGELDSFTISSHPVIPQYPYDYDAATYGNLSIGIRSFMSVFGDKNLLAPSPSHEYPIRHVNYSGELIARQVAVPWVSVDVPVADSSVTVRRTSGNYTYGACRVLSTSPFVVEPIQWGMPYNGMFDIIPILEFFTQDRELYDIQNGINPTYQKISGFSYLLSSSFLTITYHLFAHNLRVGDNYDCDIKIEVPLNFMDPRFSPSVGGIYVSDYTSYATYSYRNGIGRDTDTSTLGPLEYSYSADRFGFPPSNFFPTFISLGNSLPLADVDVDVTHSYYRLSDRSSLNLFRDAVSNSMYDIVPSSTFSTVEAFKASEGYLGVNVLQNIAKIPSISSAIPKIREAVNILSSLVNRDLSLSTLREILDLATSTVLQANFQWRPYIELFTDYFPAMLSTLDSLGDISKNSVTRGSFRFKILSDLGRKEVALLTRTKIVMDVSPSGLMSAILGIDALGLLPKVSNLWDLIPFSFAANWFTGIGESIRRAEYLATIATIPAYFVHSYSLSSPLTEDELEFLKASSSGPLPASLRIYHRDVSLYSPFVRNSRFGFGIPTSLPSVGTVGSLLYQLIFS